MGTNFYWVTQPPIKHVFTLPTGDTLELGYDHTDPRLHIGKRSAAGLYCWDCNETLFPGGRERIHYAGLDEPWYPDCPKCGKSQESETTLQRGPVAVELGFAEPETKRPTGVSGAASFGWAQDPEKVRAVCNERPDEVLIVDEYGREMTGKQFLDMLDANCPIQDTSFVGVEFS